MKKLVGLSAKGKRVGQDHGMSKITDHEIELIRELRERDPEFWTLERLAEKFEISKGYAGKVCRFEKRGEPAERYREVSLAW